MSRLSTVNTHRHSAAPSSERELAESTVEQFRSDVIRGLSASEKELPCKYLYDDAGSRLFEDICNVPEYYPTRTELGILHQYAQEMASALGPRCLLIEYGSGSSCKTRLLIDHLIDPAGYVPVDIAGRQLEESSQALGRDYPWLTIRPLCADFTRALNVPAEPARRRVVYFPGSTIGNLAPAEATALLRRTARLCGEGGGLLLGVDLKKAPRLITEAYNDSQGVTAAFNTNLLLRMNRELGTDFHADRFWHHAFYNPAESRMEMHLVSQQDQQVALDGHCFFFAQGESIRTEYSYKYSDHNLQVLAAASGFDVQEAWTDEHSFFTVQLWSAAATDA